MLALTSLNKDVIGVYILLIHLNVLKRIIFVIDTSKTDLITQLQYHGFSPHPLENKEI